jgi:hypothetical protein
MALFNFVQENAVAVRKLLFFTMIAALTASNFGGAKADNMPLVYPDGTIVYCDWGLYRLGAIVPFAEGSLCVYGPALQHRLLSDQSLRSRGLSLTAAAAAHPGRALVPYVGSAIRFCAGHVAIRRAFGDLCAEFRWARVR